MSQHPIIVVGAGVVGLLTALLLSKRYPVVLLEKKSLFSRALEAKGPTFALNDFSYQRFADWGLESVLAQANLVKEVCISVEGHWCKSRLRASDYQIPALGYIIKQFEIEQALVELLKKQDITLFDNLSQVDVACIENEWNVTINDGQREQFLKASHILACDGPQSVVRSSLKIDHQDWDYQTYACVGTLRVSQYDPKTAYEHFTEDGALALLPLADKLSFVWSFPSDQKREIERYTSVELIAALQQRFPSFRSKTIEVESQTLIPLKTRWSRQAALDGALLLGNAHHSLHPIAASGLNLSIRDVHVFLTLLDRTQSFSEALAAYEAARAQDHAALQQYTHGLARYVASSWLPQGLKSFGLLALESLPGFKKQLGAFNLGWLAAL